MSSIFLTKLFIFCSTSAIDFDATSLIDFSHDVSRSVTLSAAFLSDFSRSSSLLRRVSTATKFCFKTSTSLLELDSERIWRLAILKDLGL